MYLAMSAVLAAGILGIEQKMHLVVKNCLGKPLFLATLRRYFSIPWRVLIYLRLDDCGAPHSVFRSVHEGSRARSLCT